MSPDEISAQLDKINRHIQECQKNTEQNEKYIAIAERMYQISQNPETKNNADDIKETNRKYADCLTKLYEAQQLFVNHMKYMPAGEGAQAAKEHFGSMIEESQIA